MERLNMDGFAQPNELAQYAATDGAFLLGRIHPDHGVNHDAAIADERGIVVVAGNRAGKGTSILVRNLLFWLGGVFVLDPKGENASITAMRRGSAEKAAKSGTQVIAGNCLGQEVMILDPFGTVKGPAKKYRISYNPLDELEHEDVDRTAHILSLAELLVISEGGKDDAHFDESAMTLIAGLIEAVSHDPNRKNCNLVQVRNVALRGRDAMLAYLDAAPETDASLAREAFGLLDSVGKNEAGSLLSTLSRQLKWMADPKMQAHLTDGGTSLVQAVRSSSSVYVCPPPARIPSLKRWLRAIVRIALDAKLSSPFEHTGQQTLFLLDEFYALGHMPLIEELAAYMAGYGIKLVPVVQNLGQIKKIYKQNWETFLGNAGVIIGWSMNDHESEKYFSDRLGYTRQWEQSFGESGDKNSWSFFRFNRSQSANYSLRDRPVRWANEIHAQGARRAMRAFVISADGNPFTIERHDYMEFNGHGLFDSPDHIRKWEAHVTRALKG